LLDWTSNPLMALYFAVDARESPCPTVWIYDGTRQQLDFGSSWNRDEKGSDAAAAIVIVNPTRHSHRVVAQAGWHTVHSLSLGMSQRGEPRPMNETEQPTRLVRVAIEPQMARSIKLGLRDMGIHAATVYGDLTSVCQEIWNDGDFRLPTETEDLHQEYANRGSKPPAPV
jgi:hypothetical protein